MRILETDKVDEFLTLLNSYDPDFIDSNITEVYDYNVRVTEDSYPEDTNVVMHLEVDGYLFKREGIKEYSYERWIDTWWCDWQLDDYSINLSM